MTLGRWLPVALALALWAGPAAADLPPLEPLEPLLAAGGLAGAVVVRVDGATWRTSAHGMAHWPSGEPMRVDMRVHVGSVAKPLLSLALLRLVTQGRLTLDDEVSWWLPAVPIQNPWQATHPLRVRHLLDHTAGLDDIRLWHLLNRTHGDDMPLADAYRHHPSGLHLRFPPGTRMSYSNLGYTLAGMLIEAVTGSRYEAWAEQHLLQPLGMHDSRFGATRQIGPDADARLAWGHLDDGTPHPAMATAVRPATQFTTTADDMGRLLRFMLGDGRLDGIPFIDPALLRAMGQPAGTDAARAKLAAGYALGLATTDRHGVGGRCHEGSIVGFRALMCLYPEVQRGFFVGLNSDTEDGGHRPVYAALVRAMGLPPAPDTSATATATATASAPEPIDDLSAWTGRYAPAPSRMQAYALLDLLTGTATLSPRGNGGLRWVRGAQDLPLLPAGQGLFRPVGSARATLVLLRDRDGTPLVSNGLRTWRRLPPGLWPAAWALIAAGAAGWLAWLTWPLWRRDRRTTRWTRPGFLAAALLPLSVAAVGLTGWAALGERTVASLALAVATAFLPLAMGWELVQAGRAGWARGTRLPAAMAGMVLAACALLASHGLLPLALWR